jgi:hypothetical protein
MHTGSWRGPAVQFWQTTEWGVGAGLCDGRACVGLCAYAQEGWLDGQALRVGQQPQLSPADYMRAWGNKRPCCDCGRVLMECVGAAGGALWRGWLKTQCLSHCLTMREARV